ncbi:MAG: hypothetical protein ABI628_00135 [Chloroflexota bacterium]
MIRSDPFRRRHLQMRIGATLALAAAIAVAYLASPGIAAAHELTGRFPSPIPLGAYLIGAAFAVAASFAVVVMGARAAGAQLAPSAPSDERVVRVPAVVRRVLAAIGLLAWIWIVLRSVVLDGASPGDVASLFLWTYGWVGLALICAFVGPAWTWLDPFSTLHRLGSWTLRGVGVAGAPPAPYPEWLGRWPAVLGLAVFIWFELAVPATAGGRALGIVLLGYTVVTVAGMVQFGPTAWRQNGEVFSVWFDLVGRIAPLAHLHAKEHEPEPGEPEQLRVRSFGAGLLEPGTDLASLVLVALSVGGILFDGLSQTQIFFDLFGVPTILEQTLLLAAWLGLMAGIAIAVGRVVGIRALVAGLIPISIGYLIAHYLTFVAFDGQRILLAFSDPLGQGWDLLGIGEFEPATDWLPGAVAWSIQLVAVVGGHVVGAWAGHRTAVLEASGPSVSPSGAGIGSVQLRQVPLALLMVGLTALTLWSLGQAVVSETPEATGPAFTPTTAVVPREP